MFKILAVTGLLTLAGALPQGYEERFRGEAKCGYQSCPESVPGKLNVHLVPHTHDDVGWLKTVDQYYFGKFPQIQNAGVQYIIDSVVNELYNDPKKKFIYVETAFFWKWWKEQGDVMKDKVRKVVQNGQLEFIGGGWSMNDEAASHYQSVIDQFTWGFRKLNDTFGYCGQPKIGWQIDPFGHSREMASIMALFGFDGLFFGRLDYQDKKNRLDTRTMEMIWEGNPSLGKSADLFTGALYNHYSAPPGFCFDITCENEPFVVDPNSPENNIDAKLTEFIKFVKNQRKRYRTNNIMLTMGDDFNYQDAHRYFKNLDYLIRYANERHGDTVHVFYSTPSCYVRSLQEANINWPTKQDDFFPYGSDFQSYWTGYYTSRPTSKYLERLGNNHLQICKQISSLARLGPEYNEDIDALREAMGVMQHHDAITGTEKQHVANDYARILTEGIRRCDKVTNVALNKLMTNVSSSTPPMAFQQCLLLNVSECAISANSVKFIATVYNPISRPVDFVVRLPVYGNSYTVRDPNGKEIRSQVVTIPAAVASIPGRKTGTTKELVFRVEAVPGLGYRAYFVSTSPALEEEFVKEEVPKNVEEILIGEPDSHLSINAVTGFISLAAVNGKKLNFSQSLEYYNPAVGENRNRASGAYIFRPISNTSLPITQKVISTTIDGPVVTETYQVFSNWASQIVRKYAGESHYEIEWLIGPIPDDGREVITKYTTSLKNNGVFYTDSNGRQTIRRKRDHRPTWDLLLTEPVSGNYYPVTTDITINDGAIEVAIITDRAQGGSSLKDGEVELMLHRRLLHDDGFGVDEALDEHAFGVPLVVRGRHWVSIGNMSDPVWPMRKRALQQQKLMSPQVLLTDATHLTFEDWTKSYRLSYSGLTHPLTPELNVLTLEPWKDNTYLLRLEHVLEKTETNQTFTVNLKNLFTAFDIISVRETSLGGNRWLNEVKRLQWRKESNEILQQEQEYRSIDKSFPLVELRPKEIRTFICEIQPKKRMSEERVL